MDKSFLKNKIKKLSNGERTEFVMVEDFSDLDSLLLICVCVYMMTSAA